MVTTSDEIIRFFFSAKVDLQRREHFRILFGCDPRARIVKDAKDADVIVRDLRHMRRTVGNFKFPRKLLPNKTFLILSLNDLGSGDDTFPGLMPDEVDFRKRMANQNSRLVYLQCENEPIKSKSDSAGQPNELYGGDNNVVRLTMPMGYISGSKLNISYKDNDDSALFSKHMKKNPKKYRFGWSWIGTESTKKRTEMVQGLYEWADKDILWTNVSHEYRRVWPAAPYYELPGPVDSDKNILIAAKTLSLLEHEATQQEGGLTKDVWVKLIHADRRVVPYDKYLEYCRKSKVNIALNGVGMWCYKDSELFAYNCFCLRENHKNLEVNKLSPRDGVHHVVFSGLGDLALKIDYYLHEDEERERINDAGHQYFKSGISGGWAKHYVTGLHKYIKTGDPNSFRGLLWKTS